MTEIILPGGSVTEVPETVTSIQDGEIIVHQHLAAARLLERWKDKAAFRAILDSYGPELQQLENVFYEILVSRLIDYASGASLVRIGKIVGQQKLDFIEAQFRIWIKARIRVNRSRGRPNDIIEVLQIVEEDDFRYLEYYPASFDVHFDETPEAAAHLLAGLVKAARMAGTAGAVVGSHHPESATLEFSYDEAEASTDKGFGNTAETTGGRSAYVYVS